MNKNVDNRSMIFFKVTFWTVMAFGVPDAHGMQPSFQGQASSTQILSHQMELLAPHFQEVLLQGLSETEVEQLMQNEIERGNQLFCDGTLPQNRLRDLSNLDSVAIPNLRLRYYNTKDALREPWIFGFAGSALVVAGMLLGERGYKISGGILGAMSFCPLWEMMRGLVKLSHAGVDYFHNDSPVRISELDNNQKISVALAKGLAYQTQNSLFKKVVLGSFGLSVSSLGASLVSKSPWCVPAFGYGILGTLVHANLIAQFNKLNFSSRHSIFSLIYMALPFGMPGNTPQEKVDLVRKIVSQNSHLTPSQVYDKLKEIHENPQKSSVLEPQTFSGLIIDIKDIENDICSVCRESYAHLKKAVILNKCSHTLCPTCLYIMTYRSKKTKCPECRTEIDLKQFSEEELKSQIDSEKYRESVSLQPVVIQNPE